MPDSLPPITPAQRQRLQKLWEEARGLMVRAGSPPGRKEAGKIHELLAECVVADPGNTVYLDALLMNIRWFRSQPRPWWSFLIPSLSEPDLPLRCETWVFFHYGVMKLHDRWCDESFVDLLSLLADWCGERDLPQAEVRYLQEALHFAPTSEEVVVKLARSLLRQGRFDEARPAVQILRKLACGSDEGRSLELILEAPPDAIRRGQESLNRILAIAEKSTTSVDHLALATAFVHLGQFDEAEAAAAKALSLSGGDLAVREQVEDISLARLKNNVAIARRLVDHDPSPAHQQTLRQWEEELGRLELATLNARSERFPQDAGLKLEVAVRLKRAGNYSGAIQRLEEIAADHSQRPNVLIQLGECWQHLRQFEKALGLYIQAIASAEELDQHEPQKLALYRAGSLASAMQQTGEAKAWFQQLVSLDSEFKDARQRLQELDT